MHIKYVKGDATNPQGDGHKLIIHICNDLGGWGRGFVLALSSKWTEPESCYRAWAGDPDYEQIWGKFELGRIQIVEVTPKIDVVNMVAQTGYGPNNKDLHQGSLANKSIPLQYSALEECLKKVAEVAKPAGLSVHGPRFGSGLAGGKWDLIEPIIEDCLTSRGVPVTIYDL